MQEQKGGSIEIGFDFKALKLGDNEFKGLLDQTVEEFRKQVIILRDQTKSTVVEGLPGLQAKGVSIGVRIDF